MLADAVAFISSGRLTVPVNSKTKTQPPKKSNISPTKTEQNLRFATIAAATVIHVTRLEVLTTYTAIGTQIDIREGKSCSNCCNLY